MHSLLKTGVAAVVLGAAALFATAPAEAATIHTPGMTVTVGHGPHWRMHKVRVVKCTNVWRHHHRVKVCTPTWEWRHW